VRRRQVRALLLAQVIAWVAGPAAAWVYPEHRDIAVLAVESLDPERRAVFDRLWADARLGHEPRLCAAGADLAQGAAPTCIDWAAMSAISGDHSCSSKEMLATVMDSEWILAVADVGAQLKLDLSRITAEPPVKADKKDSDPIGDLRRQFEHEVVRAERSNALRVSDVRLQRADPQYATRAGSNNAHFLLARPTPEFTGRDYVEATLRPGSEINALGVFGWFHLSALQKATRLAHESLAAVERSALARSMLADEAFALHFLEDSYSSGHVAGTWGDVSQRKGTHDFYNENGLEVDTWEQGEQSIVLMGDAHMRPEDAHRAGESVRLSLEQLLDTAAGRRRNMDFPVVHDAPSEPDGFDVCKNNRLVARPERCGPARKPCNSASKSCGRRPSRVSARGLAPCRDSGRKSVPSSASLGSSTCATSTADSRDSKAEAAILVGPISRFASVTGSKACSGRQVTGSSFSRWDTEAIPSLPTNSPTLRSPSRGAVLRLPSRRARR